MRRYLSKRPHACWTKLWLRFIAVSLFAPPVISPCRAGPGDVDTSESLVIGSFGVTAYRVEKNYRRFVDATPMPGREPSTPEEVQEWFGHFLAQQVIIAEARREGYGERAEVCAEVNRMERHMLTQPSGPFYEKMAATMPVSELDPKSLYDKQNQAYNVAIVCVPKSAPAAAALGQALAGKSPAEWDPLLNATRESGQGHFFEGWLTWPFEPFEEIASALENAGPGPWRQATVDDTVFVYQVRGVRPTHLPPFEAIKASLPQFSRHIAERQRQRVRQRLIFPSLHFSLDWTTVGQVVDRLNEIKPDPLPPLSLEAFADLCALPLGKFSNEGSDRTITVADYIRYHNELFFRKLPQNAWNIYSDVRELVIAVRDCEDARSLGVDKQPKFTEDRENYRNYLALELYENERIRPKLGVTNDQVARYYRDHRDEFTRPSLIAGELATSAHRDEAQAAREIRTRLEKPLLMQYETDLARTLARGFKIEDRIDYKKYGVAATITKPWSG